MWRSGLGEKRVMDAAERRSPDHGDRQKKEKEKEIERECITQGITTRKTLPQSH